MLAGCHMATELWYPRDGDTAPSCAGALAAGLSRQPRRGAVEGSWAGLLTGAALAEQTPAWHLPAAVQTPPNLPWGIFLTKCSTAPSLASSWFGKFRNVPSARLQR